MEQSFKFQKYFNLELSHYSSYVKSCVSFADLIRCHHTSQHTEGRENPGQACALKHCHIFRLDRWQSLKRFISNYLFSVYSNSRVFYVRCFMSRQTVQRQHKAFSRDDHKFKVQNWSIKHLALFYKRLFSKSFFSPHRCRFLKSPRKCSTVKDVLGKCQVEFRLRLPPFSPTKKR